MVVISKKRKGAHHQSTTTSTKSNRTSSTTSPRSAASSPSSSRRSSRVSRPPRPSDGSVTSKVTLAKNWTAAANTTGWLMSEKLDGMRAVWFNDKLFSRAGNQIIAPDYFTAALPKGVTLDGELFLGRGRFQEVMSVCRSTKKKEGWKEVTYMVFDAPDFAGGISERLDEAKAALEESQRGRSDVYARVLEQEICTGAAAIAEKLKQVEADGGEGLMLRHPTADFRAGRVHDLLKVKSFLDDEALVVGHQPASEGKHAGRMGALVCKSRIGNQFRVGTGFSDAERAKPPAIGSVITYKFFELTKAGMPRFPVYDRIRPDVGVEAFA